jgi:hypothetical protein
MWWHWEEEKKLFSEIPTIYDLMRKNMVGSDRPQTTIFGA